MVTRAAVVGGTAYAVGKHNANKRQEEQEMAYEQGLQDAAAAAPPPEAAPSVQPDNVEQLKRLAELRDQGVLTEEEFTAEKRKILGM